MPDKVPDLSKVDEATLRKALEEDLPEGARPTLKSRPPMEVVRAEDITLKSPMARGQVDLSAPAARVADVRVGASEAGGIVKAAVVGEYVYGILGLTLGLASILGGVVLGLNGVAGNTSLTAKLLGLEIGVNDAVPGVILFVVGAMFIQITRPDVSLKKLR